jgi:hypothetical protein
LDGAPVEHGDQIPERQGLDLIVRDVEHRGLHPLLEPLELCAHPRAHGRVQVRERLVEQEHRGMADHRAGQGGALPLAPGQLGRAAVEQPVAPGQLRRLDHPPPDLFLGCPSCGQAEADVLRHRHVREQREALEDHGHVTPCRRQAGHILVSHRQGPRRRGLEPGRDPQQCGLTRSRGTEDRQERPVGDVQAEPAEDLHLAEGLVDAGEGEPGH